MEAYFRLTYDPELACALYVAYEAGDSSVENELMIHLCPLVRKIFKQQIGQSQRHSQSSHEGDGLAEALRIVRGRSLPHEPRSFTNYLYKCILNSMMDAVKRTYPQTFDIWKGGQPLPYGRVESHSDSDNRLYIRELRSEVRDGAVSKIRFLGSDHRACVFMIDSIVQSTSMDPSFARRKYDLDKRKFKFLFNYVSILVRAEMVELQDRERRDRIVPPVWEAGRRVLPPPRE